MNTTLTVRDITIDLGRVRVTQGGREVHLTPTEYVITKILAESAGRVVTYAEWWNETLLTEGQLKVYVRRIRNKLGKDTITNVRGFGYVIDAEHPECAAGNHRWYCLGDRMQCERRGCDAEREVVG